MIGHLAGQKRKKKQRQRGNLRAEARKCLGRCAAGPQRKENAEEEAGNKEAEVVFTTY